MSACGFVSKGSGGQTVKRRPAPPAAAATPEAARAASTDGPPDHDRHPRQQALALWQAEWVRAQIEQRFPGIAVELAVIKTQGDKILDVPLAQVGGKGLFVKEIEDALLDGRVDVAVHSMKDMPAEIPDGLEIGAVPEREIRHRCPHLPRRAAPAGDRRRAA